MGCWRGRSKERAPSKTTVSSGGTFREERGFWRGLTRWAAASGMCPEGARIPGALRAAYLPPQVYVKISVPKGIRFVGHPGRRHLTKKMCVASGEMEPTWVVLSFGDLGLSNVTGEAPCCFRHPPPPPPPGRTPGTGEWLVGQYVRSRPR